MRNRHLPLCLLWLVTFASIAISGEQGSLPNAVGRVYMRVTSPWESPPPEVKLDETFASATLVRLNNDHTFALIHCKVIKQRQGLSISVGDGIAIFRGEWKRQSDGIVVHYQKSYASSQTTGKEPTTEVKTAHISLRGESLFIDGNEFLPATDLDQDDFNEFAGAGEVKPIK